MLSFPYVCSQHINVMLYSVNNNEMKFLLSSTCYIKIVKQCNGFVALRKHAYVIYSDFSRL